MVAKLSVLHLPATEADESPFALVLSGCDLDDFDDLKSAAMTFKENCRARGMLVSDFPIEVD